MSVSLPHFYAADSKLSDDIGGLHPNEQEHAIFLDFELVGVLFFLFFISMIVSDLINWGWAYPDFG